MSTPGGAKGIRHPVHITIARFSEHLGKSALTGMNMKRIVPSAVNDHTAKCKHDATSEDFKILCKDSLGKTSLRVKESLFIHRDNPNLKKFCALGLILNTEFFIPPITSGPFCFVRVIIYTMYYCSILLFSVK